MIETLNVLDLKKELFSVLSLFLSLFCDSGNLVRKVTKTFILGFNFFSEIDFLKNENFAVSTVYGVAPHPSLEQVPHTVSEDNGRYLDIKSSENDSKHADAEEKSLSSSAEYDTRTSKDDTLNSVPCKDTEKVSSCAPSAKTAVHFDKPNR